MLIKYCVGLGSLLISESTCILKSPIINGIFLIIHILKFSIGVFKTEV